MKKEKAEKKIYPFAAKFFAVGFSACITLGGLVSLVLGLSAASSDIFSKLKDTLQNGARFVLSGSAAGYGLAVLIGLIAVVVGAPLTALAFSMETRKKGRSLFDCAPKKGARRSAYNAKMPNDLRKPFDGE